MKINTFLSDFLLHYFSNYEISNKIETETDAELLKITTSKTGDFIVKSQLEDLTTELFNYIWLKGKVPVPNIEFFYKDNNINIICVSALAGNTLEEQIQFCDPNIVVKRFAYALKLLHSIPISKSVIVQDIDVRIENARFNIDNGKVDSTNFQFENRDIPLKKLFNKLLHLKPNLVKEDLVFTHGDYCFDNILFNENELAGFVDLGNGGLADRYQDLALAFRSINNWLDEKYINIFIEEYGLNEIDQKRIEFYTLLDEFF